MPFSEMRNSTDHRLVLLEALIEYADKSGTFNPLFYQKEMMTKLGVSEGEFNIVQQRLGNKYCQFVDLHRDDRRFAISVDECLTLRDQLRHDQALDRRHRQMLWATFTAAIVASAIGAIIGSILSRYFFH